MTPSLLTRLGNAWDAFKAEMYFPRASFMGGGGMRPAAGFVSWADEFLRRYPGTNIRFEREVGNLTLSSLVMAPVQWVGRRLPEAPMRVYGRDETDHPVVMPKHPLEILLKRPNPYFSGQALAKTFALNWLIDGNVFYLKIRNRRGVPVQLWPLPYWMVQPRWNNTDETSFIDYYEYRVNQRSVRYDPADVIHFKDGADPDNDRRGLSPLRSLLREIYSDNEVGNFAAQLMRNGGIPDFILSPTDASTSLSDADQRFLKEDFQRRRTGDERGKAIGVSKAVKVERLTFNPKDMDLSAMRHLPESRLASVIGIPGIVLGWNMEGAGKYKNMEEAADEATEGYLQPLWDFIASELTHQLLPDFEGEDSPREVLADKSNVAALQEDQDALSRRYVEELKGGGITINQFLTLTGKQPVTGADVYLIPARTLPITAEALQMIAGDPAALFRAMPTESALGQQTKALPEGLPNKKDLALMRRSWIHHAPKAARGLYQSNGNR